MGHVTPLMPVRLIWAESEQKSKKKNKEKKTSFKTVKIWHGSDGH